MVDKTTDATFEQDVLKASGPVVVDFWAEWCGPCRMIAPALEEISKSLNGKVKIVRIADAGEETHSGGYKSDCGATWQYSEHLSQVLCASRGTRCLPEFAFAATFSETIPCS